jgi:hypothetical protein
MLLKPKDRESVSGDLLEEYRDSVVPARGRAAANRWYALQVGSFLLRASWAWGAMLGAALTICYLFDRLLPPTDYRVRSATLTYTIFAVCVTTGFVQAWRTRSIRGVALASFSAGAIGALLSIAGAAVMLASWHDPAALEARRNSGGLQEDFINVPLMLVAISVVLGIAGALLGKGVVMILSRLARTA